MSKQLILQMEPSFDEIEIKAIVEYIKNGGWGGEYVKTEEMETMIAQLTQVKYCSMTVNGTVSLILALLALEIKKGDEVLVPDMTMIATPNSAVILGIKPILVDIEAKTLCMDLNKAEKLATPKTKALIYVPFNGRSGNMQQVISFCKKHQLYLIEDAAQALGCYWEKKHLGTFGDIGSFSFSTPKIITTGQGGALITNKRKLYKKIEKYKDFGRIKGGVDIHDSWGWNFKFSDFLAVIGIEQLKKLRKRIKRKKEMFKRYFSNLKDIDGIDFIKTDLEDITPWFIDIYLDNPNQLLRHLEARGIGSRKIYPAIHTQKIYKDLYRDVNFPIAQKIAKKGLWLPSSIKLTNKDIDYICKEISNFFS